MQSITAELQVGLSEPYRVSIPLSGDERDKIDQFEHQLLSRIYGCVREVASDYFSQASLDVKS